MSSHDKCQYNVYILFIVEYGLWILAILYAAFLNNCIFCILFELHWSCVSTVFTQMIPYITIIGYYFCLFFRLLWIYTNHSHWQHFLVSKISEAWWPYFVIHRDKQTQKSSNWGKKLLKLKSKLHLAQNALSLQKKYLMTVDWSWKRQWLTDRLDFCLL